MRAIALSPSRGRRKCASRAEIDQFRHRNYTKGLHEGEIPPWESQKGTFFASRNYPQFGGTAPENPRVKDVYAVNPDGTELKRVGEFGNHPLWHPNSREILTNSHFPGRLGNSLALIDIETGKHRLATDCVAGTGHLSFSPDGKYIAIERVSAQDGRGDIHLVDVEANSSECLVQMRVMNHTHS